LRGQGDDKPWPQWTAEEEAVEINFLREMVAGLKTIDLAGLDTDGRINHNMLSLLAADRLFGLEFGAHHFPLNAEGGFLAGIVYSLYGRNVPDREALLAYREKLRALPVYLRWQEEQLRKGIKAGRVSPQLIVDNCIAMVERALDKPLEASLFLKPVAEKPALRAAILPLVRDTILPAYAGLRDFLAGAYRAAAPPTIGAAVMQNGKKYYEQRVRFFTTYDVSPEEVFATGQREVARIRAEMEAIIDSVGFAGSFAEFLAFLRTDPQFYATSPEGLLREASWITKRMEAKLPKYFGHLPRMPLAVAPVPDALAPNYTGGRYSPGSYERHKAGEFWVNTYDLPSRPLYVLPALALHEGVPGHHTQMMLAAEENDRPGFRDTYLSAFGEGWALYAEYLGKEAGMYVTPYEDFGRLTYEMWRACRLVVDPGMHYFGWDRERAVAFLRDNTALSLHEVNTEIDRYVGWPGQAVSYKMGELKIRELRKLAESSLGKKFDLRAFHDLLLANGSVPLSVLEELVVGFIDARK
ncbi:MAG: DUF885 domain-containing protein, partial [Bacteroidota bacterium]